MRLLLRLRKTCVEVTRKVASVFLSALLSFESLSITVWRLCRWRKYWAVLMWREFSAILLALLSVLIWLLPWLHIVLVEITEMREWLRGCCVVMMGVGVSVFSLELLCTVAGAVLRLAKCLVEAKGEIVIVWLPKSLFLLSSPTYLFPQPRRRLVEVTRPKDLLLS